MDVNELNEAFSKLPPAGAALEVEVRRLHALSKGNSNAPHTDFFEQAMLNYLVDWLFGTYERTAAVKALEGRRIASLEYNLFSNLAVQLDSEQDGYADCDPEILAVFRKLIPSDIGSDTLRILTRLLNVPITILSGFLSSEATSFQNYLDVHWGGITKELSDLQYTQKAALDSLDKKLRLEAGIYEGLKVHYGVTVELPS